MGLAGLALYFASVRWAASLLSSYAKTAKIDVRELSRFTLAAYLTGGALLISASIFNPITPQLILLSGAGASLGLTVGLLLVPALIAAHPQAVAQHLPFSSTWLILAALTAIGFTAILGPGLKFA